MTPWEKLFERTRSDEFREWLADRLVDYCAIDTTPKADLGLLEAGEAKTFDLIEEDLGALPVDRLRYHRVPIDPGISRDPDFSQLFFTRTADRPEGATPPEVYDGRANLVATWQGEGRGEGRNLAFNAHIDTIAPYVPPKREDGIIRGRGTCDDKGAVVALLGALRQVAGLLGEERRALAGTLVCMFVVEEETGGNGSLALARDERLRRAYDALLVLECCGNDIHPANRGAVWYQTTLTLADAPLLEVAARVIEELEAEGRALRAESRHPLFPQRPVQTCHGRLGPWGEHPSRICGHVRFRIVAQHEPDETVRPLLEDIFDTALEAYTGVYGDWTERPDPATGTPKVDHHYDLRLENEGFTVDVYGSTGHMGAARENDNAITKTAWLVRALARSRARVRERAGPVRCELLDQAETGRLVLEGGQGFVPTHEMAEVTRRVAAAAERGAAAWLLEAGRDEDPAGVAATTFEKLHNDAFDGDPDAPAVREAVAAAAACGLREADAPVRGWTVSCDARLFASRYPDLPVITTGPGELRHAHADDEQIDLEELRRAAEFLAVTILRQTGTIQEDLP